MRPARRALTTGLSVLAAAGMLTGATVLTATPAGADVERCTGWQDRSFSTSGFDTDVEIKLCVDDYYDAHHAISYIKWEDGGGVRKFDNFDVHVRLERYDADYDKASCDWTYEINNNTSSGSRGCGFMGYSSSSANGGWTADGHVRFDLDADGKGGDTWSLHGSPMIN